MNSGCNITGNVEICTKAAVKLHRELPHLDCVGMAVNCSYDTSLSMMNRYCSSDKSYTSNLAKIRKGCGDTTVGPPPATPYLVPPHHGHQMNRNYHSAGLS